MAEIKKNIKDVANNTAKQRKEDRLALAEKKAVHIPPMPAWKINALNQVGEDTLRQVLDKISTKQSCIVIRPTGFGKSYMLAGLTSCGNFKNCLYVYPTKVIKSDMLDTYGILGEDSRSNMLCNTTFITYKMLGDLARSVGLKVNMDELSEEDKEELKASDNMDDDEDDTDEENFNGKTLIIKKLGNENNIFDTSDTNWYRNLLKSRKLKIKEIESIKNMETARIDEAQATLNDLKAKKSNAKVKIAKLNAIIEEANNNIEKYNTIINNYKNKISNEKASEEETENISISNKDDLRNWLSNFDLILLDEAHRAGASGFISLWQGILRELVNSNAAGHNIKMVGATATPYRLDGKSLEKYIFGENSRLKKIDINDCIKPNNWEYLGISLDKMFEDDNVLNSNITREELQNRGLFKPIEYVYAIHNIGQFSTDTIEYLRKYRQSGNSLTEEIKDLMIRNIDTKKALELKERRDFCKLVTAEERSLYIKASTQRAKEIKNIINRNMSEADKKIALQLAEGIKNTELKDIFIRRINYALTTEEINYLIDELKNNSNNVDPKVLQYISREENYLQPREEQYIKQKIREVPSIVDLIRGTVTDENTYGLKYMKFIIFFANSSDLNDYIARDRASKTIIGRWFEQAFKGQGYQIFEHSLHTGKGTQGVAKIKTEELGRLKPTNGVIDLVYCVDQLNMGYHVENITGVILLRNTDSASIYNQQIGRCCSVRAENNTIMIDIIDKKPIDELIEKATAQYDFGLDKDGKQKDLKYLLDPECINVCDLNKSLIELIDKMRDMKFSNRETVRFLHFERKAPADVIASMTGIKISEVKDLIAELLVEQAIIEKYKTANKEDM